MSNSEKKQKKCFTHCHMSLDEFGLWNYARGVSNKTKVFYFDGISISEAFGAKKVSKNRTYRVRDRLVLSGWFQPLTERGLHKKDGTFAPMQYYVLSHDEWVVKHPNQCRPFPPMGTVKPQPFPKQRLTIPKMTLHHSQNDTSPFPPVGHNLIKEKSIKEKVIDKTDVAPSSNFSETVFLETATQSESHDSEPIGAAIPPFPPVGQVEPKESDFDRFIKTVELKPGQTLIQYAGEWYRQKGSKWEKEPKQIRRAQ